MATHIFEEAHHFRVCTVVWDEERKVRLIQNGSDAYQSSTPTRHNANIFPSILALLPLPMVCIIEISHRHPQRLDAGGWTYDTKQQSARPNPPNPSSLLPAKRHDIVNRISGEESHTVLPPSDTNLNPVRPTKAALDIVLHLRSALPQVRPRTRIVEEAVLVRPFGRPDDACRGPRGVEARVRAVALRYVRRLPCCPCEFLRKVGVGTCVGFAELAVGFGAGF